MDRTPQQQTGRSRRLITGVTLVTAAIVAAMATAYASSAMPGPCGRAAVPQCERRHRDRRHGRERMPTTRSSRTLGSNGRSCVTCHQPAQGWSITPAELRDRFDRTDGLDPIFRTNDGSNCEGADVSTIRKRRRAFSLLLAEGADSRRARRSRPARSSTSWRWTIPIAAARR